MSNSHFNFGVESWSFYGDYDSFDNNIDPSNLVNGKPIYYWVDESDKQIPSDAGYVGLVNCSNITVRDLILINNTRGVLFAYTNKSKIENVTALSNEYGIDLWHSIDNTLTNNNASNNNYKGIWLYSSSNNTLTNNNASNNNDGIWLSSSSNNTLTSNTMSGNDCNFGVQSSWSCDSPLSCYIQSIDTSNTVDGKPMYYWVGKQNQQVPGDAGYVGLVNCTNITVKGPTLAKNREGVMLVYTNNSRIENVNVSNNVCGFQLKNSSSNTLTNNMASDNSYGIFLYHSSSNNEIMCNNVSNNNDAGILIGSSNNIVCGNSISNNRYGISTGYFSSNNDIHRNTFIANHYGGVQARDFGTANKWNTVSGGNYWSDYTTRYPSAATNDGAVWDTPYAIDGDAGAVDNYPLVNPVGTTIYGHRPSGAVGGPVGSMTFYFSNLMNDTSFSIADDIVSFSGPEGAVTITGYFWTNASTILEVIFDQQLTAGSYELAIGPNILDSYGNAMDHDGDLVPGEVPDDVYKASFTLDPIGPRVTRQDPSGDFAGTIDHLNVWFSETINTGTFTISSVTIIGPGGSITPTAVTEIGLNCYRVDFPAQTTFGEYQIAIASNIKDIAGNLMDQDRDGTQGETVDDAYTASFNLVAVDLTLANVVVGAGELWAGEPVSISWDGFNNFGMPLLGDWTDAVYLSADDQWGIDDELMATVAHTGGLAQDGVYSESVDVVIPGAVPDDYYIIVRADLYNQEKEGSEEGNNIMPVGPIPLDVRLLTIDGASVSGTLTDADRSDYYAVSTEAGRNFAIVVNGMVHGASAEVFVSFETVPTRLDYDYRSTPDVDGDQQVLIGKSLPGTYYVHIYGNWLSGSSSYDVTASDLGEIFIASISPDHHGIDSNCIATLIGAGFDENTTVEFVGSDSSIRTPTDTQLISPTTMLLTLDVPTWHIDLYDVVVTKPYIASHELTDAFEVIFGVTYLDANVIVPSALGRHWLRTIWIEYENTGNSSMPAPLFKLHGSDDSIMTLDPSVARHELWTDTYPEGTNDTMWVMATGSGATPGILQPGDSGRIPVYFLGLKRPWNFGDRVIEFDLGTPISSLPESIDWNSLKEEVHPESMSADAWDAIWANFIDQVGDTWRDYVSMLNDNMNYLVSIGQVTGDVGSLLAFEIQQASGMGPHTYLSGDIDAFVPAPGMPLTFSRAYGQTIDSRYELGALGRGWHHSWEIYVQELSDGDVIIHGPNGVDRYFDKDGSSYKASPGDYGILTYSGDRYSLVEKYGTVWQFRSDNLLDYVEDTNGNRITAGYDSGQLTSLTHSNGEQLLLDYNANGRIWHVTDPRGAGSDDDRVTTFEYDTSGNTCSM